MLNGASSQSDPTAKGRDWLSGSSTNLVRAPDFNEARAFLEALDPDADQFVFGAHDDDKERVKAGITEAKAQGRPKPNSYQTRCASILDADLRNWMRQHQAAGWGITVSAHAMKAARRLITELAYIRVVFAEMDIGEPLRPWPLEPSMVIETSPGRYHVYWLILAEAPITAEEFHGVMMCLVETYGSDPDAKDIARTMRLPGTWNLKPGRAPHLVKIVRQTGARYAGRELVSAFPPPPRPKPAAAAPRPKLNGHTPPGLERFGGEGGPLRAISPDSYGDWLGVGMALHAESGGNSEGLALWDQWSAGSDKWSPGICETKWRSFNAGRGVTGGTIFALAAANGWSKPPHPRRQISSFSGFSRGAAQNSRDLTEEVDPLPLVREAPRAHPYPVEALGSAMAAAARAFQAKTQAPTDICANAVLAVAALAAQAHADVQLPTGETKPLSLYLITVARSGERKTSVDSLASVPVRQREADLRINSESAIAEHQNVHAAWDAERKKVLNDKKLGFNDRKLALDRLGPEPKPPLSPILVCHEPTFEGLAKLLINGQPSIGIFASEGGAFIGGHGFTDEAKMRTAAGFSLLWDDGRLTRVRAGEGSTALAGRRVALHLQAQPDVAARLFSDAVLADQGFLSRILVIAPDSKQGQRFWRDAQPEDEAASSSYVARLNELFRRPMPIREGTRNELDPRPLTLAAEARALWIAFSDEIESKLGPGNELEPISGFAAKLPEHAARIAGVLTIFDQPDATQIGAAELSNGIALSRHYAAGALRLHGASRNHVDLIDARKLLEWLQSKWSDPYVSLPDIVQLGPNATRDTAAAKRLIGILEEHRHVERMQGAVTINGKTRREVWRIVGGCHAAK